MKLYVLTDNSHAPYESGHTSVIGVFDSEDLAITEIKRLLITDNFKWTTVELVDGIPVKNKQDQYVYYDKYDSNWFSIEEHTLNEPTL